MHLSVASFSFHRKRWKTSCAANLLLLSALLMGKNRGTQTHIAFFLHSSLARVLTRGMTRVDKEVSMPIKWNNDSAHGFTCIPSALCDGGPV